MYNNNGIMGRITRDPELKTTLSGVPVVSFSIAHKRSYKNAKGEYDTDFFNVVAWRNTAEFVCNYFKKGQLMLIEGCLQTRKYLDKTNTERTAVEINANKVHFCEGKKEDGGQANGTYTPQPNNDFPANYGNGGALFVPEFPPQSDGSYMAGVPDSEFDNIPAPSDDDYPF